jgi:DNA-binding MarR family transcriptional regulator
LPSIVANLCVPYMARAAFVTPRTMQAILTNLERDGLLVRQEDSGHGRLLRTELACRGQTVLARTHRSAEMAGLLAPCAGALGATGED